MIVKRLTATNKAIRQIEFVGQIAVASIQRDDVFVLSTDLHLTQEQIAILRQRLIDQLTELGLKPRCVILTSGLRLSIVRLEKALAEQEGQ